VSPLNPGFASMRTGAAHDFPSNICAFPLWSTAAQNVADGQDTDVSPEGWASGTSGLGSGSTEAGFVQLLSLYVSASPSSSTATQKRTDAPLGSSGGTRHDPTTPILPPGPSCTQLLSPPWTVAAGRRVDPGVLEDHPDRGRRHGDAQSRELAVDPPVAPGLVLPGEPQYYRPHLAVRGWSPGPATPRQVPPPAVDDVAMPAQDGARSDEQPHPGQPAGRHRPGEQRQPRPVQPRQPGARLRPLTLGDSELMAQHQDLGVLPPRLPARQPEQ
jgi:hypothetical protein